MQTKNVAYGSFSPEPSDAGGLSLRSSSASFAEDEGADAGEETDEVAFATGEAEAAGGVAVLPFSTE